MMKALGSYLLSGNFKSVAMVSLLTILSLLFPPLSYIISGTPVGLVTLRKGAGAGLHLLFGVFLVASLFGYFIKMGSGLGAAFAASVWLPVWISSIALRITGSHGLTLLVTGAIGILFILLMTLFNKEMSDWWQSWINIIIENNFSGAERMQIQEVMDGILPLISGIIGGGIVISLITTVLLARYWQSALFNPGGFREEFYRLLLPRWFTLLTFICLLISLQDMGGISWLCRNIFAILIVMLVFQGIASTHRAVFNRKLSRNWLFVMYFFLFILPQLSIFLAIFGMVDILKRGKKIKPEGFK